MTKPKIKECPSCQTLNRINLKTCSACLSHLEEKQSLKKKQSELINPSWAASVKRNRNSSRIVNSAQHSISKLNVLGYNPILFLGHQDNKGHVTGDMIHHVEHVDGVVLEILKKMRTLYQDLLRNCHPSADVVLVSEATAAEADPLAVSSSASCQLPPPCVSTTSASASAMLPTPSPPTAGFSTAKKRSKRKLKAPIKTKTMILDDITSPRKLKGEDGVVIKEIKNHCHYVTQANRPVQHSDLYKQKYPFSGSLKEYQGLKFLMNKRLSHIERQMEQVFSTFRRTWMNPTALHGAIEGEVWNGEISLNLNDSDDDDDDEEQAKQD